MDSALKGRGEGLGVDFSGRARKSVWAERLGRPARREVQPGWVSPERVQEAANSAPNPVVRFREVEVRLLGWQSALRVACGRRAMSTTMGTETVH